MAWFKVDDKFHSNSKVRKALADDPAALALWVVAGSWSSDNLSDGFVPDHQLPWLIPAVAEQLARKLVAAGLWRRVRGGYLFHDWEQANPSAADVRAMRAKKAEAGRKGGLNSGKARSTNEAGASADAKHAGEPPTRPTPTPSTPKTSSLGGAKRATRLPKDWQPSHELITWAKSECPDVDGRYETAQFVAYWLAKSGKDATKTSWDLTFQSWFRRAQKQAGGRQTRPGNRLAGADTRSGETDWNDPKNLEF